MFFIKLISSLLLSRPIKKNTKDVLVRAKLKGREWESSRPIFIPFYTEHSSREPVAGKLDFSLNRLGELPINLLQTIAAVSRSSSLFLMIC